MGLPNPKRAPRKYIVDIQLSRTQLEAFYAGSVTQVSANDIHGLRLQFPLSSLRPFVDYNGVRGLFVISVDSSNRLHDIQRYRRLRY